MRDPHRVLLLAIYLIDLLKIIFKFNLIVNKSCKTCYLLCNILKHIQKFENNNNF